MLAVIEAFILLFFGNPHADRLIDRLSDDERHHEREDHGRSRCDELEPQQLQW